MAEYVVPLVFLFLAVMSLMSVGWATAALAILVIIGNIMFIMGKKPNATST